MTALASSPAGSKRTLHGVLSPRTANRTLFFPPRPKQRLVVPAKLVHRFAFFPLSWPRATGGDCVQLDLLRRTCKNPRNWPRFPHPQTKNCVFPAFFGQLHLRSLTVFAIVPSARVFSPNSRGRRRNSAARPGFSGWKEIYRRIGRLDGIQATQQD